MPPCAITRTSVWACRADGTSARQAAQTALRRMDDMRCDPEQEGRGGKSVYLRPTPRDRDASAKVCRVRPSFPLIPIRKTKRDFLRERSPGSSSLHCVLRATEGPPLG